MYYAVYTYIRKRGNYSSWGRRCVGSLSCCCCCHCSFFVGPRCLRLSFHPAYSHLHLSSSLCHHATFSSSYTYSQRPDSPAYHLFFSSPAPYSHDQIISSITIDAKAAKKIHKTVCVRARLKYKFGKLISFEMLVWCGYLFEHIHITSIGFQFFPHCFVRFRAQSMFECTPHYISSGSFMPFNPSAPCTV